MTGESLAPSQVPAGFFVGGRDPVVDADGGLWWVTTQSAAELVHLDGEGREAGRWAVPAMAREAIWGGYVIIPGVGVVSALADEPNPDGGGPQQTEFSFTSVTGAAQWSKTVIGGAYNLQLAPDRKHVWCQTSVTSLATRGDAAVLAVAVDGTAVERLQWGESNIIGVRLDGAAVVSNHLKVWLVTPEGKVLSESPCACLGSFIEYPVMDAEGATWWPTPDDGMQRLGPRDVKATGTTSKVPPRAPRGEMDLVYRGLTTPDGTLWKQFQFGIDWATTGAGLLKQEPGRPEQRFEVPHFETVGPLGLTGGGKLWLRGTYGTEKGRYGGTIYYGLVDPANMPAWPARGPV